MLKVAGIILIQVKYEEIDFIIQKFLNLNEKVAILQSEI
jgi:hypothetical protein